MSLAKGSRESPSWEQSKSAHEAHAFIAILEEFSIKISRSRPGAPWENGYQESFYDKFKVDLGDPGRFKSYGELVAEIYYAIWNYNHARIHSALHMAPAVFAAAGFKHHRFFAANITWENPNPKTCERESSFQGRR
jgi:hypothetical protein